MKNRSFMKPIIFILFILITFQSKLFGQLLSEVSQISTIENGDPVVVGQNNSFYGLNISEPNNSQLDLQVLNRFELGVNPYYQTSSVEPLNLKIELKVIRIGLAGQFPDTTVTLEFNYAPFSEETYRSKQRVDINGAYTMKGYIESIEVNGTLTEELPANAYVNVEILAERYSNFETYNNPIAFSSSTELDENCDGNIDGLLIQWDNNIDGIQEYQLEWLHINDYDVNSNGSLDENLNRTTSELAYDFKYNSTRISTTDSEYKISLIYDKGWLVYRLRPVGIDISNIGTPVYGIWNEPRKGNVDQAGVANKYQIDNSLRHESLLNWQYSATYAEEGKRKEVISYFDGSLRNRQTVTKINSDKNVIVGETIYDHQGRPAINVLPTPVKNAECEFRDVESAIQFYPNHNKNEVGDVYSKDDFDIDNPNEACESGVAAMSTESGSSQYYSNENPNQYLEQGYVPDAEGYPFSQVEYTPDNTGRIRRQGGVGVEFQLGTGHETEYIYSQPNQIELDRLFGSEVGFAKHYKKNTVIDAHGQASISYLDQEGRVIATALAGTAPSNLLELQSATENAVDLSVNAITPVSEQNSVQGESIIYSTEIGVAFETNFEFAYDFEIGPINNACLPNICVDCIYDLRLEFLDECGKNLAPEEFQNKLVGSFIENADGSYDFHTVCTASPNTSLSSNFIISNVKPGAYSLNKILTVNTAARNQYLEKYFSSEAENCVMTLQDFIDVEIALIDYSNCDPTCESCIENLGTLEDFLANGEGSAADYYEREEECNDLCEPEPFTPCDAAYNLMQMDMAPKGQYGEFPLENSTLSIYGVNELPIAGATWRTPHYFDDYGVDHPIYVEENGDTSKVFLEGALGSFLPEPSANATIKFDPIESEYYVYPEELANVEDFVDNFNFSWAKSLVFYHPEYCYYETCLGFKEKVNPNNTFSSNSFDELLLNTSTYEQAEENGFITTNNSGNIQWQWFSVHGPNSSKAWDPFVALNSGYTIAQCENFGAILEAKFNAYQEVDGQFYTMYEMAAYTARCGGNFSSSPDPLCFNFGGLYNGFDDEDIKNQEWEILKAMYRGEKQKMQQSMADCIALNECKSFGVCIGNEDFNAAAAGMINPLTGLSPLAIANYYASPYFDANQICSIQTASLYENKIRRFGTVEDMVPIQDANSAAYEMYLATGQCPVPFAIKELLNALAVDQVLDNNIVLSDFGALTSLYIADNGFNNPGTIPIVSSQVTLNGDLLTQVWSNSVDGTSIATLTLDKAGIGYEWDEITSLINFVPTGGSNFTIQGVIQNDDGVEIVDLTGSIIGFSIDGCNFENECTLNQLGSDLEALFNVLVQTNNFESTTPVSINPIPLGVSQPGISGFQTLLIENAVTSNASLSWQKLSANEYRLADATMLFDNGLIVTISDISPNSIVLTDIAYFENMQSSGEHGFTMMAVTVNGETAEISGDIVRKQGSVITGIPTGDCNLPIPAQCQTPEHEAFDALYLMLEEAIVNQDINQSLNLFTSIHLDNAVTSHWQNGLSSTSSILSPDGTFLTIEAGDCEITINSGNDLSLNNITAFNGAVSLGEPNNNFAFNTFQINVDIDGFTQFITVETCFDIQICEECPSEVLSEEDFDTLRSLRIATGEFVVEKSVEQYKAYELAVNSFNEVNNLVEGDEFYIQIKSFEYFAKNGISLPSNEYIKYINSFMIGEDNPKFLNSPCDYVCDYGYGTNVEIEYERYVKSIERYNLKALQNGFDAIVPISELDFIDSRVAKQNSDFVKYIESLELALYPAQNILEFFGVSVEAITPEELLYKQYTLAYKGFVENQLNGVGVSCPNYKIETPLYSFEDIEKNNLFCSELGQQLFLEFIASFDLDVCPLKLPELLTCFEDATPDNRREAQKLYNRYQDGLAGFNSSLFAQTNGIILKNEFTNFREFRRSSKVSLVEEFIYFYDRFEGALSAEVEDEIFVVSLDTTDCEIEYLNYVSCIKDFNTWSAANSYDFTFNDMVGYETFLALNLCECVDELCSRFDAIVSGQFKPRTKQEFYAYFDYNELCGNAIDPIAADTPCDEAYETYTNCIIDFNRWALTNNYPYAFNEVPTLQTFERLELCFCVDEFCARLNAISDGVKEITGEKAFYIYLDIKNVCNDPCTPEQTISDYQPIVLDVELSDDCVEMLENQAVFTAQLAYEEYINNLSGDLITEYNEHCLSVDESLTYTYQDKSYHYTLYYYDQAGNLIKTIPPAGVETVSVTADTDPLSIQINNDRLNKTKTVFTNHRLATKYEYNSLNQLVSQSSPDTDPMRIFEITLPNGLDKRLVTNQIQMVTESVGYLGGKVGERGCLYRTSDGGVTWSKVNDLVAADLNKVVMLDGSNPFTTVGFAVGDNGIVLKTIDGGFSWDMIDIWGQLQRQDNINDVIYVSNGNTPTLTIVGDNGFVAKSTDLVTFELQITGIDQDRDISAVTYSNNRYFLSANTSLDGVIYKKNTNGNDWSLKDQFKAVELNTLDLTTNNKTVAAGNDGRMYKSDNILDATEKWVQLATNKTENVNDIHFLNDDVGFALFENKLNKTVDAGNSWLDVSTDKFKHISETKFSEAVLAVGEAGVAEIHISSNDILTESIPIVPNLNFTAGISLNAGWLKKSASDYKVMLVSESGQFYYSDNGQNPNASWIYSDLSSSLNNETVIDIRLREGNNTAVLKGYVLTESQNVYYFVKLADGTMTAVYKLNRVKAIYNDAFNANRVFYAKKNGGNYKRLKFNGAIPDIVFNAPRGNAFIVQENKIVSIGLDDNVSRTTNPNSSNIDNFNYNFSSLPINDIAYSSVENRIVMSAENGVMNIGNFNQNNPNNRWIQIATSTVAEINSLLEIGNEIYTAGSAGFFNKGVLDINSKEYVNDAIPTTNGQTVGGMLQSDLNQIQTDGSKIYVVGDNGKVIYASSLNAPFTCLSQGSSNLNGITLKPGTNKFISVGANTTIHSNNASSYMAQNNIFLPEIIDFDFDNQTNGVLLAKGNNIRTTITAATSWNIIQVEDVNADYSEVEQYNNSKALVYGSSSPKKIENGIVSDLTSTALTDVRDTEKSGNYVFILNGSNLYRFNGLTNSTTQIASVGGNPKALSVSGLSQIAVTGENGLFKLFNSDGTLVFTSSASTLGNADFNDVTFASSGSIVLVGDNGAYYKTTATDIDSQGISAVVWEQKTGVYDNGVDPISDLSSAGQISINAVAFTSAVDGIYGGEYIQGVYPSYNNPEAAFVRKVYNPDGKYSSRFFYDKLGRLVVSQNARQYNGENRKYSYTLYDFLGRVVEVGEKTENGDLENSFESIFGTSVSDYFNPSVIDDQNLIAWIFGDGERREVTKSYYDKTVIENLPSNFNPDILTQRKRITHVTYEELYDGNDQTYDHASHYDYDIHGNVKTLVQDNKKMAEQFASLESMRFKTMDYTYDLVSGNVHRMSVQDGEKDQWHHAYRYDADNRITHAFTNDRTPILKSTGLAQALENELAENSDWEQDARYFYYDHGPLSRTELGDEQLQGCDYVYNLQGWLKGVNATSLEAGLDPGKDGVAGSINEGFSKDVMAFGLNYFKDDYTAINQVGQEHMASVDENSLAYTESNDLYNGNIRNMHTSLTDPETREAMPMINAYKYDQLNRLIESKSFENGFENNTWNPLTYNNAYYNNFRYDAMGNILEQKRNKRDGVEIENLTYQYDLNTDGKLLRNRLYHVNDEVVESVDDSDIDDMGTFTTGALINESNNYSYDGEGRLIKDEQEGIAEIIWRVDGKVKEIKRVAGSDKKNVSFDYDAMGNRIAKHITNSQNNMLEKSTYYILDAQGNTMNTYDHEVTDNAVLYTLKERQIYGSSRLGIYDDSISMYSENTSKYINEDKGHKYYELSNHLGNVLTVISDKKIPQIGAAKILDFQTPITESFDYGDVCAPDILFYEASQFSGHIYEVDANGNTVYQIDGNPHSVQYSLDGLTPGETYTIAGLFVTNNSSVSVEVRSCENAGVITNPSFSSAGDFSVSFIAPYDNVRIKFLSLGGEWAADDITFSGPGLGSSANCFIADIVNIADYSPFGVQLDGRTITSDKYRYGFQGSEKDDEVSGEGNSYTTQFRQYDVRIGRWLSLDPKRKVLPWESPYSFSNNTPIFGSDPKGDICTPCLQFVVGFALDVLDQMGSEMMNGATFGEAWDGVSLWQSTLAGGFGAANPAGLANKIATSPMIRKLVSESIEILADLIQSAVNSYYDDGEVDVYDLLMEAIYGPSFRKAAKMAPKIKTPNLDKKIKSTQSSLDRQSRLVTDKSSNARKSKLNDLQNKSDVLDKKKKLINSTKEQAITQSAKTIAKGGVNALEKAKPSNQKKEKKEWKLEKVPVL